MFFKYFKLILGAGILLAAAWFLFLNQNLLSEAPWTEQLAFSYPDYATRDSQDNLYVIDNARRRLIRINPEDEATLILEGGSRQEGRFFYAPDLSADSEGNIYLLNIVLDDNGYFLVREEILVYDVQGRLVNTLYRQEYGPEDRTPTLVQRGRIQGLDYFQGSLHWFMVDDEGIQPFVWSPGDSEPRAGSYLERRDAALDLGNVRHDPRGGYVFSTKAGQIYRVGSNNRAQMVYEAPRESFEIVPWEVAADGQGRIYFVDLMGQSFRRVESQDSAPVVLDHSLLSREIEDLYEFNYYRLSLREGGPLVTTNEEAALEWSPDTGEIRYVTGAVYLWPQKVLRWSAWASPLIILLGLILLFRVLYVDFLNRKPSQILLQSVMIILVVAISAVVVSNIIIPNLTNRYQDVLLEKISQMLQVYPRVVDGDRFQNITGLEDYDGEDYNYIRETFLESLNYNRDPWNESYYFALYRVIEGRLYAFMYLNGAVGTMHPFDWIGWEEDGVYDLALEGEIATEMTMDVSGEWIYGVSPIYNSQGEVVALFETGTDLYTFRLANEQLVRTIFLEVLTTLVILVLLMIELSFLYQSLQKRRGLLLATPQSGLPAAPGSSAPEQQEAYSDVQMARPLSFLLFTAVSMSLAFIPIMMGRFYEPVEGFTREFLLALPISLEMFFFGLATILAGFVVKKTGWRFLFLTALVLTAGGLVFSGLSWDMASLNLARALTGLGSGLGYISLRSLINQEGREELRSQGFSHFYAGMVAGVNAGVVFGAGLADSAGFSQVFFVAALVVGLALVLYFLILGRKLQIQKAEAKKEAHLGKALGAFLTNGRVWIFFLFLILPTYLAGTFLGYYFPLFAESQGISTADIGRLFIVNGLFIIYLGPPLSRAFKKRLGDYGAVMLGSVLWGLSLVIFALTGTLWGAVAALVIMGITEGFCVTAQNDYYLNFDVSRQMGEDRAVGYFELFGKVGETLGPIGFSLALLLGQALGILSLGIVIILMVIPALLFLRSGGKQNA